MIVKWSRSAIVDLKEIHDFVGFKNPYAAASIQKSIIQATRKLGQFPNIGRAAQRADHRLLVETRYGYVLVYRVVNNAVEIAFVHDGRMKRDEELN